MKMRIVFKYLINPKLFVHFLAIPNTFYYFCEVL